MIALPMLLLKFIIIGIFIKLIVVLFPRRTGNHFRLDTLHYQLVFRLLLTISESNPI